MSNRINDGGPAFPLGTTAGTMKPHPDGTLIVTNYGMEHGMTLRDYFAAAALQGLLAYDGDCSTAIGLAYHTADAMLDWRKKNP